MESDRSFDDVWGKKGEENVYKNSTLVTFQLSAITTTMLARSYRNRRKKPVIIQLSMIFKKLFYC